MKNTDTILTVAPSWVSVQGSRVLILLQMVALWTILYLYDVESGLYLKELLTLAAVGFVLNNVVAPQYRHGVLVALSAVAVYLFTGVVGLGFVLSFRLLVVYIASLDAVAFGVRLSILTLIFSALVYVMVMPPELLAPSRMAISILGSMFVFRLSIFLYDRYNGYRPGSFLQDLSYFFMLPNMGILLFPIIDYKVFNTSYDVAKRDRAYTAGIYWISTGVLHLLVYRIAYFYFVLPPENISAFYDYWYHIGVNYFLIIRLSGIFHFSIGILCVLGYHLPPAFDNYFLSSGFSDLWRRINIYFRDYMNKLFYLPLFFRFRSWGQKKAMLTAVLMVFAVSWFLHSAQFFWLRGVFPLKAVDGLFWAVFGILVAANVLIEKRTTAPSPVNTVLYSMKMVAQIMGMYMTMSLLWSLWSTRTLSEWVFNLKKGIPSTVEEIVLAMGFILAVWLVFSAVYQICTTGGGQKLLDRIQAPSNRLFWSLTIMVGLLLWQIPGIKNSLYDSSQRDLDGFYTAKLNIYDQKRQIESYYEEILDESSVENLSVRGDLLPASDKFMHADIAESTKDIRIVKHKANTKGTFKNQTYTVNQHGIRGRPHEVAKTQNTYRTALLGGSYVSGSGVSDQDVFDYVLEAKLNALDGACKYEFWNFGNPGFDLVQSTYDFITKSAADWSFDRLIYFSHGVDDYKNLKSIIQAYQNGYKLGLPYLDSLFATLNISPEDPYYIIENALYDHRTFIISASYRAIYDICIENDIRPTWIFWPMASEHRSLTMDFEQTLVLVRDIGFDTFVLNDLYHEVHYKDIIIGDTDHHPNALGHKIMAERLEAMISKEQWQCAQD